MSYFPDHVLIGGVRGTLLFSDAYLVAELRVDPWSGFDLGPGAWNCRKGHKYEKLKPCKGAKVRTVEERLASLRYRLARRPGFAATREISPVGPGTIKHWTNDARLAVVRFDGDGPIFVDPGLLRALVRIIGGEPTHWRGAGSSAPIQAYDGRKWLGALMPLRVPRPSIDSWEPS